MAAESSNPFEELGRVLGKLSMKNITTWDPSDEDTKSITSHLKSFENAIEGADLNDKEKIRELIGSLKGQALDVVENLIDVDKMTYHAFKQELIGAFHKEKPMFILIREFYGLVWRKEEETLREFAMKLILLWKMITKTGDFSNRDEILKCRLIQGILEVEPEFGKMLQFTMKADATFKELTIQAEQKFDVFKNTLDRSAKNKVEYENGIYNNDNSLKRTFDWERPDNDKSVGRNRFMDNLDTIYEDCDDFVGDNEEIYASDHEQEEIF